VGATRLGTEEYSCCQQYCIDNIVASHSIHLMGRLDSWNPLKHQEPRRGIGVVEGPGGHKLEAQQEAYQDTAARGQRGAAEDLQKHTRKMELAKNIMIKCSVEHPLGWETVQNEDKEPTYDSGSLKVTFDILENGQSRVFETTAHIKYVNVPGARITVVGQEKTDNKPDYIKNVKLDKNPWESADKSEDSQLKQELASDVFRVAMDSWKDPQFQLFKTPEV